MSKTENVSRTGALLTGLPTKLAVGDIVGLTYKDKKCRFRVVWTGKPGATDAESIGLQSMDPANWVWDGLRFPADDTDTYTRSPQDERRKVPRIKCLISAEIVSQTDQKVLAFATSISIGGCYVHMPHPFPLETRVSLALWLDEQHKIWVDGIVVSSHRQTGMVVKFLGLTQRNVEALEQCIEVQVDTLNSVAALVK